MNILVYDHDESTNPRYPARLETLADGASLSIHTRAGAKDDTVVVKELLNSGARVFFVHVDPAAWRTLVAGLDATHLAAVRFSTEVLGPTPRATLSMGGLHINRPLSALRPEEFAALVSVFSADDTSLRQLRDGVIPKDVRSLIAHRDPHHLRALYVLVTGTLACWAADDTNRDRARLSREALGVHAEFATAPIPMDSLATWRRCLNLAAPAAAPAPPDLPQSPFVTAVAEELGLKNATELQNEPDAEALIALITQLTSGAASDRLAPETCRQAHAWLQRKLRVHV